MSVGASGSGFFAASEVESYTYVPEDMELSGIEDAAEFCSVEGRSFDAVQPDSIAISSIHRSFFAIPPSFPAAAGRAF